MDCELNSLFDEEFSEPLSFERSLWSQGYKRVAGVDEAGRGALAGPVVAAAVVFSDSFKLSKIRITDSKKLSPIQRDKAFDYIREHAMSFAIGIVHADQIDQMNILQATLLAMKQSLEQLSDKPDICLIDGNTQAPINIPQRTIVQGDSRVTTIGAASILAKVTRDRWMCDKDIDFPMYQFKAHKGYGTALHIQMLREHGFSNIHRKSFQVSL